MEAVVYFLRPVWSCVIKSCSPRNSTPHIITSDGGTYNIAFDVHVDGTGCVSKKYWRDFKCLKQWYTFHCIVYCFSCLLSVCLSVSCCIWQWWHVDMDPVPVLGPTLCHELGQVELLHTALLLHGIWIGTPCTVYGVTVTGCYRKGLVAVWRMCSTVC